jgi:hypothetical protein
MKCEEFKNEKKKGQNNFDLPEQGCKPQIFSNFPAHDLNFLTLLYRMQKTKKVFFLNSSTYPTFVVF